MSTPDLFEVLEIEESATAEQIRKAYFRLAKQLHPDRQAVQDQAATERFLAVQRAYEVLSDPAQREEYERKRVMERHSSGPVDAAPTGDSDSLPVYRFYRGPSIEEERDARLAYQKAEALMETGAHDRALRAMHAVVRTVPDNPDYASLLGYLMAHQGEKLHAARDYCRRAIEAEPFNPLFHARLGYVYVKAGLGNTAQQCFAEALRIDPKQPLALEWADASVSGKGGGLGRGLKRIFGL